MESLIKKVIKMVCCFNAAVANCKRRTLFTIDFGEVGAFERIDAQVEAGNVLHIGEHRHQRIELIGQPEIGECHLVERSGECFVLVG